jgi:hypothetical protein
MAVGMSIAKIGMSRVRHVHAMHVRDDGIPIKDVIPVDPYMLHAIDGRLKFRLEGKAIVPSVAGPGIGQQVAKSRHGHEAWDYGLRGRMDQVAPEGAAHVKKILKKPQVGTGVPPVGGLTEMLVPTGRI